MAEFDLRNTAGEGPGDNSLNQSMKSFENSTLNFTFATAKFSKIEQGFEKATSNFQRVTGSIEKAATNLKEISSSISKASDRFVKSADKISDLGTSIKKASDVMSKNSDVLSDAGKTFSTAINGLVASIEQLTKNIASGPFFTGAAKKPAKKESPKAKSPEIEEFILDISDSSVKKIEKAFAPKPNKETRWDRMSEAERKQLGKNPALTSKGKPYGIDVDLLKNFGKFRKLNEKEIADQVTRGAKAAADAIEKAMKPVGQRRTKKKKVKPPPTPWEMMSEEQQIQKKLDDKTLARYKNRYKLETGELRPEFDRPNKAVQAANNRIRQDFWKKFEWNGNPRKQPLAPPPVPPNKGGGGGGGGAGGGKGKGGGFGKGGFKLPQFDLLNFSALKIMQPILELLNDVFDAILAPLKGAADILGAPFRKFSEAFQKGVNGIKAGFSILGDIMDSFGENVGKQTEYIIKSMFASQGLNSALQSVTVSFNMIARQFAIASKKIDFQNFGLEQIKGLQGEIYKLGDDLIKAITISLINPIRGLPALGKQVADFVNYFAPAEVSLFNSTLRDFNAVIGKALTPVLKGITVSLKKFGDALYGWLDKFQPKINAIVDKFVITFEKAIPKIIAILDFFITELTVDIDAILSAFNNMIGAWAVIADFFSEIARGLGKMVVMIPKAILMVFDAFFAGTQLIVSAFGQLASYIPVIGKEFKAFADGFTKGVGKARDVVAKDNKGWDQVPDQFADLIDNLFGGGVARKLQNAMNQFAMPEPKNMLGLSAPTDVGFKSIADVGREAATRSFGASGRDELLKNAQLKMAMGQGPPLPVRDVNPPAIPGFNPPVNKFDPEWDGPWFPDSGVGGDF